MIIKGTFESQFSILWFLRNVKLLLLFLEIPINWDEIIFFPRNHNNRILKNKINKHTHLCVLITCLKCMLLEFHSYSFGYNTFLSVRLRLFQHKIFSVKKPFGENCLFSCVWLRCWKSFGKYFLTFDSYGKLQIFLHHPLKFEKLWFSLWKVLILFSCQSAIILAYFISLCRW